MCSTRIACLNEHIKLLVIFSLLPHFLTKSLKTDKDGQLVKYAC